MEPTAADLPALPALPAYFRCADCGVRVPLDSEIPRAELAPENLCQYCDRLEAAEIRSLTFEAASELRPPDPSRSTNLRPFGLGDQEIPSSLIVQSLGAEACRRHSILTRAAAIGFAALVFSVLFR